MSKKFKIKKNDKVIVITGDDRGKIGNVLSVSAGKIIVSGVNIATIHKKPSRNFPEGGIIKSEKYIDVSNVAHLDPKLDKPTKVGYKISENGKKVRYSKLSGEIIDTI